MTTPPTAGLVAGLMLALLLTACTTTDDQSSGTSTAPSAESAPSASSAPRDTESPSPPDSPAQPPPVAGPPRLERWFDRDFSGGGLRLGAVRERTSAYTSYDVTYRSQTLTISGVLNVPRGPGPFPAVVLAHGYIDPAVYVRGQGMTRERGYLAERGYVALHVDYRGHAESDRDPRPVQTFRFGYAVDVINAVNALRGSDEVPVDDSRVALFGRSMGGGVVQQVLEMAPGLVAAGVAYASVSSDAAENFGRYHLAGTPYWGGIERTYGTPAQNPSVYRNTSTDQHFDRVTEPVLLIHGRYDDTCPPRWARHTRQGMADAGVDVTLGWFDDGHAFGPAFGASMHRTVGFLDQRVRP